MDLSAEAVLWYIESYLRAVKEKEEAEDSGNLWRYSGGNYFENMVRAREAANEALDSYVTLKVEQVLKERGL